MEGSFNLTLQIIIAVLIGIFGQVLGEYWKVPSIVFLLLFGILLGGDGLNILHPYDLGVGLEVLVALSVAIILFEGGLNLELRDLSKVSGSLRNLVTIGTLVTLAGGGLAAYWLAEFPLPIAFLYASLVVVTGPTVISPLLKQVSVDRQVATLLEGEGVLIDPIGAILAVVVLNTILNTNAGLGGIVTGLLLRLTVGAVIGTVCGWLMAIFIKQADFLSDDLKNLVVLAGVWGLFGLSQALVPESGLMATVAAGIVLNAASVAEERLIRRFKGQLTILCVSVLFVLLAADLSLASIWALGWGSLLTVLTLMFVVRPLSVYLCTANSGLNWRQKLFLAWVAPKGIVSASVASLFAILLTEKGINGGDAIKALVFLTIVITVFAQGLTAGKVAQWLQITSSEATGAVIIGCNPLGRLLGQLFQQQGESVVLIDTDPEACKLAKANNLPVFQSSALDPTVLEEAGIESMGTFIALNHNTELNLILAQRALEEFRPPRVLAVTEGKNKIGKIEQAFVAELPIKEWNKYISQGQFKLAKITLREANLTEQISQIKNLIAAGELLPLIVKRDNNINIVKAEEEWLANDEIICVCHDPRPELLKRLSGANQSSRLALDKLPEIEFVLIAASSA
ncbi:MAG: sodium:proton antiporter [Cyanobacteria bacterium J083]|nr:MAG: sodium:proton antiporter [Cyanobacteria bacterium J083]